MHRSFVLPARIPTAALAAVSGALLACAGEREVVVTRDQLGEQWPLEIESAVVLCSDSGAVLKVGARRYALDEGAEARGYPHAQEVARADVAPLLAVCEARGAAQN